MLKCRDMAELVTPYLEGTLPLKARLAAMWHLWLCEACRRYVEQMRRTVRFLHLMPPIPPENESEIMALLQRRRDDQ